MTNTLELAILKTLSYYDVFQYPLSRPEIWKYLTVKCDRQALDEPLSDLIKAEIIFCIDDYYCLNNDPSLVMRRKEGNRLGKLKLKKAMSIARFLGMFPFVEAVCISGSLSKDFALPNSDLDYFIITSPNRLWVARNIMHCFRKITFLVNKQRSFCMNYYISSEQIEISPKNLYTAIELSTLKTGYVHSGIHEMSVANEQWVSKYLPNIGLNSQLGSQKDNKWLVTRLFEQIINKIGGDAIESLFYKTTMKRWTKKWDKENYDVEKCILSVGLHFNTPVNYPIHLPNLILKKHFKIYKEVVQKYINHVSYIIPTTQVHEFY